MYKVLITIISVLIFINSCQERNEYEKLVQRELDRNIRYDTLFLGYKLGMEQEDFFNHSWDLNQQNKITGIDQINYNLDKLSSDAIMIFYPEFYEKRIYRMPVEVSFSNWAIWNRNLYSDSLIVELIDWFEDTYGPGFKYMTHPELGEQAWIKIDGNRRISVYRKDDMTARVEFVDLSVIPS